jgi:hypothetical protein
MPLTQFLEQESATFDPPTVKLMTDAYLEACRLLRPTPRDDGVTRLVAKRIIDAARSGERDPSAWYAAGCGSGRPVRRWAANCAAGVS